MFFCLVFSVDVMGGVFGAEWGGCGELGRGLVFGSYCRRLFCRGGTGRWPAPTPTFVVFDRSETCETT